jgi:hypothetical protein
MSHDQLMNHNQPEIDRGAEHTFICRAGVRWHIDTIFSGCYFNVSRVLHSGSFEECTIICPPHKQHEMACDGPSKGGPPYCLNHNTTKRHTP